MVNKLYVIDYYMYMYKLVTMILQSLVFNEINIVLIFWDLYTTLFLGIVNCL